MWVCVRRGVFVVAMLIRHPLPIVFRDCSPHKYLFLFKRKATLHPISYHLSPKPLSPPIPSVCARVRFFLEYFWEFATIANLTHICQVLLLLLHHRFCCKTHRSSKMSNWNEKSFAFLFRCFFSSSLCFVVPLFSFDLIVLCAWRPLKFKSQILRPLRAWHGTHVQCIGFNVLALCMCVCMHV